MMKKSEVSENIVKETYPDRLFLTLKEACSLMGLSTNGIYNRRSMGKPLPFKIQKVGGRCMVAVSEMVRLGS